MRTRVFVSLLTLTALACATQPAQQPLAVSPLVLGEDEQRVVETLVVITDASHSMYTGGSFPEAKALTQTFVASLPDRDVRAEDPARYAAGTIGFGGGDRSGAAIQDFNRPALVQSADELDLLGSPQPNTPLDEVLDETALALAGRSGRAAVVIFSDGEPNSPPRTLESARALAMAVPGGVCIHTVQTGDDPEGAAFLKQLSTATGCGSSRRSDQVASSDAFMGFTRTVMVGPALPGVAAVGPCGTVLRLRALLFDFDKAAIREESAAVLDAAVAHLKQCGGVRVRIQGHTDSIGSEEYNDSLSVRRAQSVRRYFIDAGVDGARLSPEGLGERQPLAPNDSQEGRAENRRVEIKPQG